MDQEERLFGLRRRLVRFFSSRGLAWAADDLADDTILRVLKKLREGLVVDNLEAYTLGVARNVLHEFLRALPPPQPPPLPPVPSGSDGPEFECLDRCLERHDAQSILLRFYGAQDDIKNKDARRSLANLLGISPGALYSRVTDLRRRVEACVIECLDGPSTRQKNERPIILKG